MIFGVDVSHHQGAVDHRGVRGAGMDFLIAKISQGTGMRDKQWARNRDGARAAGLIVAGYHYIDTADAAAQARNCAAHIGDRSIPVALDHERGGGDFANFRRVLDAFRAVGLRVVLSYIPPFYWREIGTPNLAGIPPLWKARYPTTNPGTPSGLFSRVPASYWDDYGGNRTVILQFADSATITGQRMDCNAYRGTRDQLIALLGGAAVAGGGVTPPTTEDFLMGLPDAEQRELQAMIRTIHQQLGPGEGAGGKWGWRTWNGGTRAGADPETLTVVDYLRRGNVRTEDILRKLDEILAAIRAGGMDPQQVGTAIATALGSGLSITGKIEPKTEPKIS